MRITLHPNVRPSDIMGVPFCLHTSERLLRKLSSWQPSQMFRLELTSCSHRYEDHPVLEIVRKARRFTSGKSLSRRYGLEPVSLGIRKLL